ncbi:hypothetical protein BAY61_10075 [Prauserella marina]|nr:hypothetical protein BAY61_10075 [Prauserella marina]
MNAAVAIATALAALGVTIAFIADSPVRVVLAVVLLAVAVSGSWAALVNRGARRLLACSVAVVTLLSLLALPGPRTYLVLMVVIGLCLLSTAAARVALAGEVGSASPGARVPPAARGVLLLNPRSGGGKVERFRLDTTARERGVATVVMSAGDDVRALAERAVAEGADVLGMAGGDGSQAIVADVAREHGVAFVCVPAGTRNHFALDLGLDRDDMPTALDAFGPAIERRVDLAAVNGRVFVNNASLGVYAALVRSPGYREAKFATVARTLPDLLGPKAASADLRFTGPGPVEGPPADIVVVSNGAYRLEHLTGFGSRERLDAGTLGVVTISVDRAVDVPALVSAELTGRLRDFHGYRSWLTPEFIVDSGQALVDVGIDGEELRLPPPLRFISLPSALRVRVPRPPHPPMEAVRVFRVRWPGSCVSCYGGRPDGRRDSTGRHRPDDRSRTGPHTTCDSSSASANACRSRSSCSCERFVVISEAPVSLNEPSTRSATASLLTTNSADVPGTTCRLTSATKSSSIPAWASEPASAPKAAPTAVPSRGTKNSSPNRNPQKPPPSAPLPVSLPRSLVLGFFLPSGQET